MMLINKKTLLGILSLTAIFFCASFDGWQSMFLGTVAAQAPAPTTSTFTGIAETAVFFITLMEVLAFIIFNFLEVFLDPLFILDMVETKGLNDIWRYSRNIMNVIFAFMLIAAGIFTVVTGNKEVVQQKFKKFILAVVLVNFSWFFPRVILDVANVLTATIYQLPAGLNGGNIDCKLPPDKPGDPPKPCKIITKVRYFDGCVNLPAGEGWITKFGIVCYTEANWRSDTNTSFGMLNGLVINYAKLGQLSRVIKPNQGPANAPNKNERYKEILKFLVQVMLIMLLSAMLFLPLAAMFVVFLIRIPIMWVTICFMPFMFLGFVMGDKMGNFDSMKIFEHYIKAAFLPTAIAVPFAAGFLILTEITQKPCPDIAGPLCANTGPLLSNVSTLWGILMILISMAIIWFGFWSALSIDDIYVKATSGIKSLGESLGKTAIKLPLSVPIPVGGGKKMSVLGVDDALNRFSSTLSRGGSIGEAAKAASPSSAAATSASAVGKVINDPASASNKKLDTMIQALERRKAGGEKFTAAQIDQEIKNVFNTNQDVKDGHAPGTTDQAFNDATNASIEFKKKIQDLQKP